jgi:hypothetical protein
MKPQAKENYRPVIWLLYMLHTFHINVFFKVYYDIRLQNKLANTAGNGDKYS